MRIKLLKEGPESTINVSKDEPADATWDVKPNDEESEEISDPDWSLNTVEDDPDATLQLKKPEDYAKATNPDEEQMKAAMDAYAARNSNPLVHLRNAGFEGVDFLGRGQFGYVYSADHPSGREMAVKAVEKDNPGHDRELRAYKTIGNAREKSESIAKHFPLIYTIDTDSHDQYSFIAMERLTDEGPYADIVKDLFSGSEYLVHPRGDLMMKGAWKDLSRRMRQYFNNDQSRNKIIDTIFENTPEDFKRELKAWAHSWKAWTDINMGDNTDRQSIVKSLAARTWGLAADAQSEIDHAEVEEFLKAIQNGYYFDALEVVRKEMKELSDVRGKKGSILRQHWKKVHSILWKSGIWLDQMVDEFLLYNDRDTMQDEFGGLKREFEEQPWMAYFILEALRRLKEYRPEVTDPVWGDVSMGKNIQDFYWTNTSGIINGWLNMIRQQAPIGIHHKPEQARQDRAGAPKEVGDSYEEVKSIRAALDELERITGLAARDMHDKNVMMRPIDGSVVIVDVGMFKPRSEIKQNAQRRVNETKTEIKEEFYNQTMNFDFSFDDFRPKTGLHPSFWDQDDLFSEISRKLKQIAQEFAEDIEINTILDDILLVGSIASYNWHEKADIDLHLVIDFEKVNKDEDLVEEYMRLHRMRWNEDHNIRIYGHEVEIYVQDAQHKGHYAGIYSIMDQKWIKKPQKDNPEIDFGAISNKAATIANEIRHIDALYRKDYTEEAYEEASALKKKIRDMRQSGLEGEGMYSVENLAFKLLRNNGYLRLLSRIQDNSYDISHSIGKSPIIKLKITKKYNEAWAIKSGNKHGKPAGLGSLAKPTYMTDMSRAGDARKAYEQGEELVGWDKYAQLVAEAYEKAPEKDPMAAKAFEQLGHHVLKNIKKVQSAYDVQFVDGQPYASAEEMATKMKETGVMLISKDFNQSEVFGEMENLYFRAVHDYYGHLKARGFESDKEKITKFNLVGELQAYNGHLRMLKNSEMAKAVFTEVIGQACYFMYNGYFPDQKVVFLDDFDHINVGRIKGYDIVDQNLVSTVQEKKKRKKRKKKRSSKVTYPTNPRSRRGRPVKNHWNVGSWWYGGGYGDSGGDSGGDGGGGE